MRKRHVWTLLLLLPLLTGCQIFPAEEALPAAPVIQEYTTKEYQFSPVIRGDMTLVKRISCKYVPTKQEQLAFTVNGETINEIYVAEGDHVEAGDLIADLVADNLEEQIASRTYTIQSLETQLRYLEEKRVLELERLAALDDGTEEFAERVVDTEASFAAQKQSVTDSLYIERMVLSELQEDYSFRKLYANISGTVVYVREIEAGERCVKDQALVTIADLSTTAFKVEGEDAQLLPVGMEVTITAKKKEIPAVSADATELGLDAPAEGEKPAAYLKLSNPDPTLEDGDSGKIEIVLETREDTLYVKQEAIKTADTGPFVYILNEEGLKVMHPVTPGLKTDGYMEILEGLEEGDSVILE